MVTSPRKQSPRSSASKTRMQYGRVVLLKTQAGRSSAVSRARTSGRGPTYSAGSSSSMQFAVDGHTALGHFAA